MSQTLPSDLNNSTAPLNDVDYYNMTMMKIVSVHCFRCALDNTIPLQRIPSPLQGVNEPQMSIYGGEEKSLLGTLHSHKTGKPNQPLQLIRANLFYSLRFDLRR